MFLVRAVMFGMMTAGFHVVMFGMAGMAMSTVGMVRRFFVIAGFVMFGGFTVMFCRVLVMFSGLMVMLDACMVAHVRSPGSVSCNVGMIKQTI
jgi:hypothetical protein